MISPAPWREIGLRKRAARDAKIPAAWRIDTNLFAAPCDLTEVPLICGILSTRELHITSDHDVVDLVGKLQSRVFSAEEVAVAFCKRAAIAQQLTNCLTEIFFDEAIERAKALDEEARNNPGKTLRPFHGLPISLKDTYQVTGVDASIGLACLAERPSTENSTLTDLLLSLGAVLYCKTNVPQTMMTADSENHVFGRTINPLNRSLTAGGSTGGEGPLVRLRGSILGFGTDLGGSIRIPALCNGLYGFKPSAGIVPFSGQVMPFPLGWETIGIIASAGMLATSSRACAFVFETIVKACPADYDSACMRLPWIAEASQKESPRNPLRVGFVSDDGLFTPTPPVRRALKECRDKLERAGVQVVDLALPDMMEALSVVGGMFALDGSKYLTGLLDSTGEPLISSVVTSGFLTPGEPLSMDAFYDLSRRRGLILDRYCKLWQHHNIDAILMPPAPYTAVPLDTWSVGSYTVIWNLLDCPSIAIPVGVVNANDTVDDVSNAKYGERDTNVYKNYTGPEDYADAPIAIQLVGKRQDDQNFAKSFTAIDGIIRS